MSWSGPVTGTTQYQTPPYTNGQPSFGQPQIYQYGQQQGYSQYQPAPSFTQSGMPPRPPENRPPKKKGNPIITRYPPPPGYRGPAQPQAPFGTNHYPNHYQQTQQSYPQGPSAPPTYPTQGYQAPPATQGYPPQSYGPPQSHPQQPPYSQPGYPQALNYQWPQQAQQAYPPQPSGYPNAQGYGPPQPTYPSYPTDSTQQAWPQAQGWQQTNTSSYPPPGSYSAYGGPANSQPSADTHATPAPTSANPATSQSTPTTAQPQSATSDNTQGEKPQLFLAWDDWDFDFDGAIWPKANEPVDPNLSLGVIIWRPAKQVTRALPCTYADAEEQALKPPAEKLGNGESVSIYFTTENSHEAFLDVRQTDGWYKIQRDPVFVIFTDEEMAQNLVPIEECVALRDRPDEPLEAIKDDDEEMHDSTWNVMDHLEQALSSNTEDGKSSGFSQGPGPSNNQTQEDVLARLGVTGSPKPPSNEPMPFSLPMEEKPPPSLPEKPPAPQPANIPPRPEQPPQRAQSYGGHHNSTYALPPQRPYGSMSSSLNPRPAAADRQQHDPSHPSNTPSQTSGQSFNGSTESPARSEGTLAGSDFEPEKPPNSLGQPIPQLKRSDSSSARKRSYEDIDQEDGKSRQQDDHTKRKRRSQVDAAYSRR